ncbi:MAG TPA: PIN domain-containing protein [Micropruina sp.]|nr:PIN domain-containing protein [Micropruina sp.]HMR22446.1 PIN domain-containing protein [Micropruina sp.]
MIVDTSALLAYFDANEPAHRAVASVIDQAAEPLVISPYVVAELDYLLLTRHGTRVEQAVLDELSGGAWDLADFGPARLRAATAIVRAYRDVPIGVTDASLIVLAGEYRTDRVATLDRRHFSILRLPGGDPVQLLPG